MFVLFLVLIMILPAARSRADELPFAESFESLQPGSLQGQNEWSAAPPSGAQVQNSMKFTGSLAGILATNSIVSQSFSDTTATNVWVDFYTRSTPHSYSRTPCLNGDAVAGFYFNSNGFLVARSNATWVTLSDFGPVSNQWYRFTVNLDYQNRRWGIFSAGATHNELLTPVATNLAFSSTATNTYFHRFSVKN